MKLKEYHLKSSEEFMCVPTALYMIMEKEFGECEHDCLTIAGQIGFKSNIGCFINNLNVELFTPLDINLTESFIAFKDMNVKKFVFDLFEYSSKTHGHHLLMFYKSNDKGHCMIIESEYDHLGFKVIIPETVENGGSYHKVLTVTELKYLFELSKNHPGCGFSIIRRLYEEE